MAADDREKEYLAFLDEYRGFGASAEALFDEITQLAARICDVPISLINLVGLDHLLVKSAYGLPGATTLARETALCTHTLMGSELMEVPDATVDPRFRDNPLVTGEPRIRFYAGVPLINRGGDLLGSLCVIDRRTRTLSPSQRTALQELARLAVSLLETGKAATLTVRLGEALESAFNEIYFINTRTQRIEHANQAARRNLQYTVDELKQLSLLEIQAAPERDDFAAQLSLMQLGRQKQFILNSRQLRKDGSTYPVEIRVQISDGSKTDPMALAVVNDMSERKRLLNDLWQTHERLWTAVQASPLATLTLDVGGAVTSWNPAAETLFGWPEQEVLGKPPLFVPRERYYEYQILHKRVLEGETLANIEMRRKARDGKVLDLSLSAAPLRDSGGRVTGVMVLLADRTETRQAQKALRREQDFSRTLLENLSIAVIACDSEGQLTLLNRAARELAGTASLNVPPEQWSRRFDLYYPDAVTPLRADDMPLLRALRGDVVRGAEVAIVRPDFPPCWFLANGDPLLDASGKPGAVLVLRDITERRHIQQIQSEEEKRFRLTLDNALDAFVTMDVGGSIIEWNRCAEALFGWSRAEALGKALHSMIIPERYRERHVRGLAKFLTTGEQRMSNRRVEIAALHRDGHEFPVELSVVPINLGDGYIFTASLRDITETKNYQQQLEHQVNHDILTGLPNRNLLKDRMAQAIMRAQRFEHGMAVAFIDLDGFKLINDSLGHEAGDEVLKTIAERLKICLRDIDTVARLSGDEFVLVLNDQDGEVRVQQALDRILTVVAQPLTVKKGFVDAREVAVTGSIGYSIYPRDGRNGEELARKADTAMYRAKELGRNRYEPYSTVISQDAHLKLSLESGLRHALERDEFFLEYQPQVNLASGRIVGAEALLRWRHPETGRMGPESFIRLAENSGMIVPIGEWVLATACAQNKAWLDAGLPTIKMAVNLSAHQFRQTDLDERVLAALDLTGLDPDLLDLELAEGLVMRETGQVMDILMALKALGVRLSIDDFGSGHSSLGYLKQFPVDRLKIDQSFVQDLVTDRKDTAIVQSMISLAHGLDLKVTAKGVETEAQLAYLRTQHCDEMQGYYFSKPVPAEEFEALLREGRRLARRLTQGPAKKKRQ